MLFCLTKIHIRWIYDMCADIYSQKLLNNAVEDTAKYATEDTSVYTDK
jgi:hypothetical protein